MAGRGVVTWRDGGTTLLGDLDIDGIWAINSNFGTDLTIRNDPGFVNLTPPAQPQRGI